jgi:ligand-binding sensor domain-containing protein
VAYGSTDGGAHWTDLTANLPETPASSIVVDPQDAGNTVYMATDEGVYFTTQVGSCPVASQRCWSVFGSGLPEAPVVALSASPAGAASPVLVAGTYGRGIWWRNTTT